MNNPEQRDDAAPETGASGVDPLPDGDGSSTAEEAPVPATGERFGLNLGNPIESEGAAFSWLVLVIIAGISVGAVAKLISPLASVIWVLILLGILAVPVFRGLRHQLGSPDEDE